MAACPEALPKGVVRQDGPGGERVERRVKKSSEGQTTEHVPGAALNRRAYLRDPMAGEQIAGKTCLQPGSITWTVLKSAAKGE